MKKLLLSLFFLGNLLSAVAQPNTPANHNLGCTSNDGAADDGITDQTVISAGDRTSNVSWISQQNWGSTSISTTSDNTGHTIYKFTTQNPNAAGGFAFSDVDATKSNYVHVALYADGDQSVKVRLATSGGYEDGGKYTNYQVDTQDQPLHQGWNYLNIPLSDFAYVGESAYNFKINKVSQVGFTFSAGNKDIYVDDIYFFTKPIVAANHNLGCTASTGNGSDEVKGIINVQPILSAGGRNAQHTELEQQIWDGVSAQETLKDASEHDIYKFIPAINYGNGGFYFKPDIDASKENTYLHAALYAEAETHVQVRLATGGGSNNGVNTYPQYEVNTTQLDLKPGWNYLNLLVDVKDEDRQKTNNQEGFAYWAVGEFHFNKEKIQQVGFVVTEANHSIYIDDIYFYELPYSTEDDDKENIDWNTSTGTSCYVTNMIKVGGQLDEESQNPLQNASDGKNNTYLGITRADAEKYTADNPYYIVAQLQRPITVSDVEMIWGNGYPLHYEAYALKSAPTDWTVDNIKPLLTDDNMLFRAAPDVVNYEPFFNTFSELDRQGKQNNDTRYVVVKMWGPMGSTFGFKLNEIHVGAFDNDYYVVDHIGAPNFNFRTEKDNQQVVEPTARNKRNAILKSKTVTSVNYKIEGDQSRYITLDRDGNNANVWASMPGTYTLDITGTVDGADITKPGKSTLAVTRDWLSDRTNTPSMIQGLDDANFSATITQTTEGAEGEFNITHIKDRNEATRWSSGSDKASAENQFVTIKLSNDSVYKIRDLEFLWERAYPATYAVYGLNAEPSITAGTTTYAGFKEANSGRLLYEANLERGVNDFPYHDLHILGTGDDNVKELNDTKYLVVAFSEPIQQMNNNYYGVSIWELYAQGTNMTKLVYTDKIQVNPLRMYVDTKDNFTVQGIDASNKVVIDKLNDATFAGASEDVANNLLATTSTLADNIYTINTTIDGQTVKVADIWDAGNNTYSIQSGTDKRIAGKKFNITVNYNKDGIQKTNTFSLYIIKKPMALLPTSTETNLVFDDGYYVEQRLEKEASSIVRTVDLTNVDFSTDYAGNPLSNIEITAPRWLNYDKTTGNLKDDDNAQIGEDLQGNPILAGLTAGDREEMNPNAIYYVNQDAFNGTTLKSSRDRIHGENVALKDNSGTATNDWYIDNLRVYDGYDFAPSAPTANPDNIRARRARFYTNIPAKKKTTLIFPFDVSRTGLDDVKFYTPSSLKMNDDNGEITLSEETNSTATGNNIYIVESASNRVDENGGYAVTFQSSPYNGGTNKVTVYKEGATKPLNVSGASVTASLESSFVRQKLTNDGTNKYYLYSATSEGFRPAADEWFDFDKNPQNADKTFRGQDLRNVVLPFYAYLKVTNTASLAKVSWLLSEDTTTGITNINDSKDSGLNVNAPMYDVLGRRVNSSYRGIVIQNGKKYIRN